MHRLLAVFHKICCDKKQQSSRNLRAWICRELVGEMFYMQRIIACKIASTNLTAAVSKEYLANIYCMLTVYFRIRYGSHHIERSLDNCVSVVLAQCHRPQLRRKLAHMFLRIKIDTKCYDRLNQYVHITVRFNYSG